MPLILPNFRNLSPTFWLVLLLGLISHSKTLISLFNGLFSRVKRIKDYNKIDINEEDAIIPPDLKRFSTLSGVFSHFVFRNAFI